MTLAELKTLIQNYVQNTETTFVNTLDDFIKNAKKDCLSSFSLIILEEMYKDL